MPIYEGSRYEANEVARVIDQNGFSRVTIMPTSQKIVPAFQFSYYTVVTGDRIDILAYKFFGDAELWWVIAEHNPQWSYFDRLPIGTVLRIPNGIAEPG